MLRHHLFRITIVTLIASLALAGVTVMTDPALTQDEKIDFGFQPPSPEEMAKMNERYMKACTPSKYYRWLEQMIGEWEYTMKMFWAPGTQPMESKGTATVEWSVPGKFIVRKGQGSFMGQKVDAFTVMGYDNFKQKFVTSSYDSFNTWILHAEGTLDKTGKILMTWGTMDEPMTGENDKMVGYRTRIVDEDTFVFEVHDLAIGAENNMVVEMTYRRKK